MPHIHTEPGQHDHTASAYIIRTDFDEPKIMLHIHKKLKRYMQFGGHIELDETPWQAISHEVPEETGYDMSQLQILQPVTRVKKVHVSKLHPVPLTHITHPFGDQGHFHTDAGYGFVVSEPPKNKPVDGESSDIKLFTRAELVALKNTFEDVRTIGLFVIDECLAQYEKITTDTFEL